MTDAEVLKIRTVCRYCHETFRYLGSHIWQAHRTTARAYKQEIGVELQIPLTNPDLEQLQKIRSSESFDKDKFLAIGAATRFVAGENRPRYISPQFHAELAARNSQRRVAGTL